MNTWGSPTLNTAPLTAVSLESAIASLKAQKSARGTPQPMNGPFQITMSPTQYDRMAAPHAKQVEAAQRFATSHRLKKLRRASAIYSTLMFYAELTNQPERREWLFWLYKEAEAKVDLWWERQRVSWRKGRRKRI